MRDWMRFRGTALAVLGLALCAAGGPLQAGGEGKSADSLIEKHLAWRGGRRALDRLEDLEARGRLETAGLEGTIALAARRDGFLRIDSDLGALKTTRCVAGGDGWVLNPSGQVEEMGRVQIAQSRRDLARLFAEDLRGGSISARHLGSESKDGRSWEVVRLSHPDGDAYDLLIDAGDGSTVWVREIRDTETFWARLTDWRTVEGVRMPFRERTFHESRADDQTIVWTEIGVNTGVDEARFVRPEERRVARIAQGAAATGWIPFDADADTCICVRGEVNGTPTRVLLDSGAGITVLDRATAERAGIEGEGSLTAEGVTGSAEAALAGGVRIRIGELEVGELTAAVIDLASVNPDLAVILGKEVFHNVVVDVDYPGSRVRFLDPARFRYEGAGHRVPLVPAQDGHRRLEMRIEELPPAVFELDTGSNDTLDLFRFYTEENGLLEDRTPVSEHLTSGVGGSSASKVATLRSVTLGGYELTGVPASFHRAEAGSFHTKRAAGNLGARILERFRVLFDYGHECLWLEPGPDWNRPFAKDRSGLQLRPDGDAEKVVFVAPGSPAAAAGWRVGERVVAIDGKPTAGNSWGARHWKEAPAGTVVVLETSDGSERKLTLADYY